MSHNYNQNHNAAVQPPYGQQYENQPLPPGSTVYPQQFFPPPPPPPAPHSGTTAPALPPRPGGAAAMSSLQPQMSFPPPPRSPNPNPNLAPPLPPRAQQQHQQPPHVQAGGMPAPQAAYAYAHPTYAPCAPYTPSAPHFQTPAPSAAPGSYHQAAVYYPPPPPMPLHPPVSQTPAQTSHDSGLQQMSSMLQSMSITLSEGKKAIAQALHRGSVASQPVSQPAHIPPQQEAAYPPPTLAAQPPPPVPDSQQSTSVPYQEPPAASYAPAYASPSPSASYPSASAPQPSQPPLSPHASAQEPSRQAAPQSASHGLGPGQQQQAEAHGRPDNSSSSHRSSPQAAARPSQQPHAHAHAHSRPPCKPVAECIDEPVPFAAQWYTHASAPDFFICSKCYVDKLWPTQFRDEFVGRVLDDGVARHCRFNVPRISDRLLGEATSTGSLHSLVAYMRGRAQITDCKRQAGAKGSEGIKWFKTKGNAVPGMLVCEACFQDIVCISPFAGQFEPELGQGDSEVWACDLPVLHIRREFDDHGKTGGGPGDWAAFANEARLRLGLPACPGMSPVKNSQHKWFIPVASQGPPDAVLCVACFCDYVVKSGQEHLWQERPRDASGKSNVCMLGQFHLNMAMRCAATNKSWPVFWRALKKIAYEEKPCDGDKGIVDGKWYTFASQPDGFSVCGACYAGIVEPMQLAPFFVRRTARASVPAGTAVVCSLNASAPRFQQHLARLLETWYTRDSASWEAYARRFGGVPRCPRDTDVKNRAWYGWNECVICPECYLGFVQGTALDTAQRMPLRPAQVLPDAHICEMYSPRMRTLYQEACARSPPDPAQLLALSAQRRTMYWQTIPVCRKILVEQKHLAFKAKMAGVQGSFYTNMGQIQSATINYAGMPTYGYSYGGHIYHNLTEISGLRYNALASDLSAQVGGSKTLLVGQLEKQWRAVE